MPSFPRIRSRSKSTRKSQRRVAGSGLNRNGSRFLCLLLLKGHVRASPRPVREPNNEANTILIKAYPPSGEAKARWYSLYEAQEQKVLFGREELNIYMNMAATNFGPVVSVGRTAGDEAEVEWPARAVDYVLEQTTDLTLPNWQFINRAAETNGSRYVVTFPASEANRFFRRLVCDSN